MYMRRMTNLKTVYIRYDDHLIGNVRTEQSTNQEAEGIQDKYHSNRIIVTVTKKKERIVK